MGGSHAKKWLLSAFRVLIMSKKKIRKVRGEKPKVPQQTNDQEANGQEEKLFDFGGLPERDLKKNLGCG